MRTTSVVEPPRPADSPSPIDHSPQTGPIGFLHGPLIVTGLVGFWTLLLVVNLVSMPVRVVRRLVRR